MGIPFAGCVFLGDLTCSFNAFLVKYAMTIWSVSFHLILEPMHERKNFFNQALKMRDIISLLEILWTFLVFYGLRGLSLDFDPKS